MDALEIVLLWLGGVGHVVLWVSFVNRLHAWPIRRILIDTLTLVSGAAIVAVPLLLVADYANHGRTSWPPTSIRVVLLPYAACCALVAVASLADWLFFCTRVQPCDALLKNHTFVIKFAETGGPPIVAEGVPGWLSRLPGNEATQLSVHDKRLGIPRLSPVHEGLRIAHLSDLHMSGRITKHYFAEVASQTNALNPDLIVITGDLFDRDQCLDWIGETLAKLHAPHGVFFVLGNHDQRVDYFRAVDLLIEAGLTYIGGRWLELEIAGEAVVIAGNELPWFPPAADPRTMPPRRPSGLPLRILLSHSPDEFHWAEQADFDLVLAGHTHGGQIRIPLFGAIVAPSRQGTKYASGIFQRGETVMHVSRGTSHLAPLRWNCPPELAVIQLACLPAGDSP